MNIPVKVESITYDQNLKDFVAMISCADKVYRVTLLDFSERESDKASKIGLDICNWVYSRYESIREFCATKLLDLKNENWLDELEEPLSKKRFAETIEIEGVLAFSEGSFELYFDDKDIFWGHVIVVDVDKDYVLTDARIAG